MAKPLRIALTKGRLEKDTVELLEALGYDCTAVREKGRRLILPVGGANLEVVLAKAADVITYVERGVCDMGVVGKDTIMESGRSFYASGGSWVWTVPLWSCRSSGERFLQRVYPKDSSIQIHERGPLLF